MPDEFGIRPGYASRPVPKYFEDAPGRVLWQPDVYADAQRLAQHLGSRAVIDLGCGQGVKLARLEGTARRIGIDFGPNLAQGRARFAAIDWREHDLCSAQPLPVTPDELEGATVICSDVLEHLVAPAVLLRKLAQARAGVVLLSTPERELTRGLRHAGPPGNSAHVREWSLRELSLFLTRTGLPHHSLGLTRSSDESDDLHTILALIAPGPEQLAALSAVLIDRPLPPAVARPLRARWKRTRRALFSSP